MTTYFPEFFQTKNALSDTQEQGIKAVTESMLPERVPDNVFFSMESIATTDSTKAAFFDLMNDMKNDALMSGETADAFLAWLENEGTHNTVIDWCDIGDASINNNKPLPVLPTVPLIGQPTTHKKKRKRLPKDVPVQDRLYVTLTDQDVILGRGGGSNKHAGNKQFHEWKMLFAAQYHDTPKKLDRTPIALQLLDLVHSRGGRFLDQDDVGWYQVCDTKAREKCSQALRDSKITAQVRKLKRERYPKKKA